MSRVPRFLSITALMAAGLAPPAMAAERTAVFLPTGAPQTFTVPRGVTSLDVEAIGGHGGAAQDAAWRPGGRGARVTGRLTGLRPGQRLTVMVGGNGDDGRSYSGGLGGYNGGGDGISVSSPNRGGGGGGASDVRTCAPGEDGRDSLASRLVVAAGGGGGAGTGNVSNPPSGAGGDAQRAGEDVGGDCRGVVMGGRPGEAGRAGAGGGADSGSPGADGVRDRGGSGVSAENAPFSTSGAGGGGLFGGGSGASSGYCSAGGGGGANLVPPGGTATWDDDARPQVRLISPFGEVPAHVGELDVSRAAILGTGRSVARVSTVVTDADGLGVSGAAVSFRADDPDVRIEGVTDDGDGTYNATVRATGPSRPATLRVSVAGLDVERTATLRVVTAPTTAITSPADGTAVVRDVAAPPAIEVAGRADAGADAVDVGCRGTTGSWSTLRAAVPVQDGRFQAQVRLDPTTDPTDGCRLVAVPSDPEARLDDGPYAGPALHVLDLDIGREDGAIVTFTAQADGSDGAVRIGPVGVCGVRPLLVREGASSLRSALRCGGSTGPEPSAVPVTVDDAAAWSVLALADTDVPVAAGVRDVDVHAEPRDDGGFTVTERTALVRCAAGADPGAAVPTATTCASVAPTGVELQAVSTVAADGVSVRRTETYRAVDGLEHRIVVAAQRFGAVRDGRWRLPGAAQLTDFPAGATLQPAPGVGAVRVALDGTAPGAVVHAPMPDRIVSTGAGYLAGWPARTATPDAPVRFSTTWVVRRTADDLDDAVAPTVDAARPTIALDAPEEGASVSADVVRVTGRATAAADARVTVGARTATVAPDGTFAVDVPVVPGENRIVARVTDAFGVTAVAVRTVVRQAPAGGPTPAPPADHAPRPAPGAPTTPGATTAPPAPGRAAPATLTRAGRVTVRGHGRLTIASGLRAACAAGGSRCTATLAVRTVGRRGVVVGRSTVTLRPGAGRVLTVRPTGAVARALARGRAVRVTVVATVRAGTAPAVTASRTVRLRPGR